MKLRADVLLILVLTVVCSRLSFAQKNVGSANLTFTTIDVLGATITNVWSINSAGQMAGTYSTASDTSGHGFLYASGAFTFIDYLGADGTFANGINDSGQIVGYAYIRGNTAAVSFIYQQNSFTTVRVPGEGDTIALGINNKGIIVGGDGPSLGGSTLGFARIGKIFKTIAPSGGYLNVYAEAINNVGEVVGLTVGPATAFIYKNGKFQTFSVAGAVTTYVSGVNDSGIIVGSYDQCSLSTCGLHGYTMLNDKYEFVDYPGALSTAVDGVNNAGQLVGSYTLDNQVWHGFVTSPITSRDFSGNN